MTITELQRRADEIRQKYDALNAREGQATWSGLDRTAGLVTDVGELMELVMAKEGKRRGDDDVDAKLAHELSDILWSVLVIAQQYDIDIEQAFHRTMDELDERLAA